jgi:hypothetical protein
MPSLTSPLEALVEPAQQEGLSCTYLPADDQLPIEYLLCFLGQIQGHEMVVECSFPQSLIDSDDPELGPGGSIEVPDLLQMIVRVAIPIERLSAGELARFMIEVNRSLAVGQFGFCLETSTVYLQYALASTSRKIDPLIFTFLVGNFQFAFDWLMHSIKEIASARLSCEDAIAALKQEGFPVVPMHPGFSKKI